MKPVNVGRTVLLFILAALATMLWLGQAVPAEADVVVKPDGTFTFAGGTVTTPILFPDGTEALPAMSFANDPDTGFWRDGANSIGVSRGATQYYRFSDAFSMRGDTCLGWHASTIATSRDVFLCRDAANTFAQRNGTNAQGFRVYNTFTDSSNYERIANEWSTNIAILGARAAGTGTFRGTRIYGSSVAFFTGATDGAAASRWTIDSSGHLTASTDNSYDIGASGATRPRDIFVADDVTVGGDVSAAIYLSATNCSSSAAPAVCSAAPAGSVVIAAAATTVTVNTTAVTANSQIFIQEDSSLGTKLSVTCNTTTGRDYTVTARTGGTSFVITASASPVTNPACLSYYIIN